MTACPSPSTAVVRHSARPSEAPGHRTAPSRGRISAAAAGDVLPARASSQGFVGRARSALVRRRATCTNRWAPNLLRCRGARLRAVAEPTDRSNSRPTSSEYPRSTNRLGSRHASAEVPSPSRGPASRFNARLDGLGQDPACNRLGSAPRLVWGLCGAPPREVPQAQETSLFNAPV